MRLSIRLNGYHGSTVKGTMALSWNRVSGSNGDRVFMAVPRSVRLKTQSAKFFYSRMKVQVFLNVAAVCSAFIGNNVPFGGSIPSWTRKKSFSSFSASSDADSSTDIFSVDRFSGYALRTKGTDLGLDTVKQYAGYFDVKHTDKHFFYYFFESRNDPQNDPVILWINGGPGCSTIASGLLFELGPSFIDGDLNPVFNPYAWNSNASIVFLDQPIGTGFSYGNDTTTSSAESAKDSYVFLELFFGKFPQYKGNKFHISGESYAGHYIPAITTEIISHPDRSFQVDSILIGNGFVSLLKQSQYDYELLCGSGGIDIFSGEECSQMHRYIERCHYNQFSCLIGQLEGTCKSVERNCELAYEPIAKRNLNPYDLRKQCGDNPLCYDSMTNVSNYLNSPKVREALGVPVSLPFEFCNPEVGYRFAQSADAWVDYDEALAEILDHGIPVLLYAGDKDYVCNWVGFNALADYINFEGSESFQATPFSPWTVKGKQAGEVRNYDKLTFLRVYDSGHMVPHDQPEVALAMLATWLAGDSWAP